MLYLPHFLVHLFHKRISNRLVAYLLFAILLFGMIPLLALLDEIGDTEMVAWSFCFIPQVQPFLDRYTNDSTLFLISGITASIYILLCLTYAIKPLLNLNKLEQEESQRLLSEEQ